MFLREIDERFEKKHASLFQQYYIILNAIPKVWKQNILREVHVYDATQEENEGVMKNVLMNVNTKRKSKFFFTLRCLFIQLLDLQSKRNGKNCYNSTEQIEWKVIWSFNLQAMKENKISEFNFKLLHNLLPNRYNLFKWKLCNNPLCLYDDQLHDNLHLFVKCKHTRLFWLKFGDIIRKLYNVNFSFDKFVLIEGYNLKNKIFKSLNFLIIYAKYAVYLTFMQAENRKLMFDEVSILCIFKRLIHNRLKIERNCKTKNLCIFKNTLIQENETCFMSCLSGV